MKRKLSALAAITLLLALAVFGTWGIAMYCVTSVAAEYAAERYLINYGDFASTLANRSFAHWLGKGFDQKYARRHGRSAGGRCAGGPAGLRAFQ